MRARALASVGALAILWAAPAIGQGPAKSGTGQSGTVVTRIETAAKQPYGQYLTDAGGRALYLFMKDERGKDASTCYDACAQAWPPALAGQGAPEAGPTVQDRLLGSFERQDGSRQLTYNGWPLYYFVKDRGPGDVTGQDLKGFGGEWYLVAPDGSANRKHGEKQG